MTDYIAAVDQGTTSTRFIIFDHDGNIAGIDQKEHRQIFARPGWVEHDPLEVWHNTQVVIQNTLEKTGIQADQIKAIGVTNQRETVVVWDKKTGRPFHNAVVWQCARTDGICKKLIQEQGQDRFRKTTGLPVSTYFSGPKIQWILDNVPEAKKAAARGDALFGTMDTWVIWNLTGGPGRGAHVTDVTNASRTLLMDINTLDWDQNILSILGIPESGLPQIKPSSDPETWGITSADGPMGAEVPVCAALGDQQAALFGQACFEPGEAKNTYGTGCFLLLNTGQKPMASTHGLITTLAFQLGRERPVYALEGSIANAGSLVQWVRDNLGLIDSAPDIEALASRVQDNGDVYCVPAFSGLFAPYWRSDARGIIAGLTGYATKSHIARAVLEATAFQARDIVEAMNLDSGVSLTALKVDGGMIHNALLMQFQADLLDVPVIRPRVAEATSRGAAWAAGLAIGFWSGTTELKAKWSAHSTWTPDMTDQYRRKVCAGWKKAVERTLNWVDSA